MNTNRTLLIKISFYIGVIADLGATLPLLFPGVARLMFGLEALSVGEDYLYASRVGASLMLGWTLLLLWGSFKPVERKGILLLTVFPVLIGLLISSLLVVSSGFITVKYILPIWIFYAVIIPLYLYAYYCAYQIERGVE